MKISDCCGAAPRSNGDSDTEDIGICPEWGDHCEYIEEDEEQEVSQILGVLPRVTDYDTYADLQDRRNEDRRRESEELRNEPKDED